MKSKEIWLPVVGYEKSYMISNKGVIKTLNRKTLNGFIMKPFKNKDGYYQLSLCLNGVKTKYRVHRLVAITFIQNPQNKSVVNHINGIKTDNSVENLEWCTPKENDTHATINGFKASGERNGSAKFSNLDVIQIRKRLKLNHTQLSISLDYNVNEETIGRINRGVTWKNIGLE